MEQTTAENLARERVEAARVEAARVEPARVEVVSELKQVVRRRVAFRYRGLTPTRILAPQRSGATAAGKSLKVIHCSTSDGKGKLCP